MRIPVRWVVLGVVLLLACLAAHPVGQILYAWHHVRAGDTALDRRDFAAADAHFAKALAVWPNEPGLLLKAVVRSARLRGDFATAERHLSAFRKAHGPAAARETEQRLMRLQGGDMTDAVMLAGFCEKNPENADTPFVLEALIVGALTVSESMYFDGVTPQGPALEVLPGTSKFIDQWSKSRDGEADRTQALVWRGRVAFYSLKFPRAAEHLREALQRDPERAETRFYLALALEERSPADAAEHLAVLQARDPADRRVLLGVARVQQRLGHTDEARALLEKLLRADPANVTALVQRGLLALGEAPKRLAEAEIDLGRAVELAPDNPSALHAFAAYCRTAGKPQEAKRCQDKARRIEAERKRSPK